MEINISNSITIASILSLMLISSSNILYSDPSMSILKKILLLLDDIDKMSSQ